MVLVGNDNDKNAGCFGGSGVEEVFRQSSDISPMKVASGNAAAVPPSCTAACHLGPRFCIHSKQCCHLS